MSTYIALTNYTDQGIRNIKDATQRLDAAKQLLSELGGSMTAIYLTMGAYDLVAIIEMPSDDAAAQFALRVGSLGNVRTTTLKAFTESEYRSIIQALP
ncbi:MAG: GYD domain-containing protein [Kiloniellales bacterium]